MMLRFALLVLSCTATTSHAQCAHTPVAAAQAAIASTSLASASEGFRATEAVVDVQSGHIWMRVIACNHPERPAALVPLSLPVVPLGPASPRTVGAGASNIQAPSIAVRPGDTVRVRFASADTQVQIEGRAEEQGAVGQVITVRMQSLLGDNAQPRRMKATVTARGEATILP